MLRDRIGGELRMRERERERQFFIGDRGAGEWFVICEYRRGCDF